MVVPALLYVAVNAGGEGAGGWGIVMATDIAFVLGALALVGPGPALAGARVPADLGDRRRHRRHRRHRDLLLGGHRSRRARRRRRRSSWRSACSAASACGAARRISSQGSRSGSRWSSPACTRRSRASLLGLLTPCTRRGAARSSGPRRSPGRSARRRRPRRRARRCSRVGAAISPNERLQELLHPWTSYVVVPLFALANAGVPLGGDAISRAVSVADHDRHRRRPRRGQDDRHLARVLRCAVAPGARARCRAA